MSDKSIQVDSISGGFIITAQTHEDEAWERSVAVDPEVVLRRVAKLLGVDVRSVFAETEDTPEQPKDTSNEDSTEATVEPDFRMADGRGVHMGEGKMVDCSEDEGALASLPIGPMADLKPGAIINPVVDHEDNEFTGERTYVYADGTRSDPCPAPASWSPSGQVQE